MSSRLLAASAAAVVLVCLPLELPRADDKNDGHFEFTMGFVTGEQKHSGTHFKRETDSRLHLDEPFLHAPFNQVHVHGLRYELRLVSHHVRMTAGFDVPFTSYQTADATNSYEIDDRLVEVVAEELRPYDLHFGIGGEYWIGPVAAYADLLGGVHWTYATFLVDGEHLDYSATSFNFWARVGLRFHVKDWLFLAAAGEIGLVGDLRWAAELSVGFAIM
ncbi:MAG: hypothetical protein JRJ87_08825 [Deltaproteobacteria bacterium]|nr:hypothetical protein [Deltaproteobacteria bacterium]